jgi:hypothetical protein
MRRREAAVLAALIDAVVAPEPPLPPVRGTDALPAFADWLRRAPRPNRAAVRVALLALELAPGRRRFSALDRSERLRVLHALDRRGALRAASKALRSAAAVSYYGDAGVLRAIGHDPAARVREARERRARSMRPAAAA